MLRKLKSQARLGENICKAYIWLKKTKNKKLISIVYKEFSKSNYRNIKENKIGIT